MTSSSGTASPIANSGLQFSNCLPRPEVFVPAAFRDLLGDHYYALPRGRITRPKGNYMVFQGNDAPLRNWKTIVVDRFRLSKGSTSRSSMTSTSGS